MAKPPVTARGPGKFVLDKFFGSQRSFRMVDFQHMAQTSEDYSVNAKSRVLLFASIVDSARLREDYANSHASQRTSIFAFSWVNALE